MTSFNFAAAIAAMVLCAPLHAESLLAAPVIATMSSDGLTIELTDVHGTCGKERSYYSVNPAGEVVNQDCWHADASNLYLTMAGTVLPMPLAPMKRSFVEAVTHRPARRALIPSV
ncbi:hypothetical protein [Caballeronia sordidicola]|nr:hypothetical protein [Caballeronia sordidicola]